MYEHNINCKCGSILWVIICPDYPTFGISFDKRGSMLRTSLVSGHIEDGVQLNIVDTMSDITIPVPVLLWFAQHMHQLRAFEGQEIDLQTQYEEKIVEYAQ